jgi:hypothetical protein
MSFAHQVRPRHRPFLPALDHPDGTTRAQTLKAEHDPSLAALLRTFGRLTGYRVLVNTSLNGRGEPIVETPREGVQFLIPHEGLDALLIGNELVKRRNQWASPELDRWVVRLAPGAVLSNLQFSHHNRTVLSLRGFSGELSPAMRDVLGMLRPSCAVQEMRSLSVNTTVQTQRRTERSFTSSSRIGSSSRFDEGELLRDPAALRA